MVGDRMKLLLRNFKKNIKDMDRVLLIVTIFMFVFGLLNIVTASSRSVVLRYNTSLYNFFYKQLLNLVLGSFAGLFILNVPTKNYKKWGLLAFAVVSGLLLYLSLYGSIHKGSINWINFMGVTLQPSELAKPTIILCLSVLFELFAKKLRSRGNNHYDMIGIILIVGCIFPLMVFLQHDLGTAIILFGIFAVMFFASPILRIDKLKTCILGIILIIFGSSIIISKTGSLLSETQLSRFDFFDPCSKYESGGYQICNGFIAINEGGFLGVGIGDSKQISYIPESHTDSVFAIIAEENGFIRSTLIFVAYIIILSRILNLSSKASTLRGRYICLGVATYIFLHILINLGGLFGVMPLTGVPLPFLSYGGSFTLSLIIALSMVQRIHIETKNQVIKI